MKPKALVVGAAGQLGRRLVSSLGGDYEVVAWTRAELDLGDLESIGPKILALRPSVVVNAAAYTAVDKAQSEPELARRVNGQAPGLLGQAARELGIPVVHFSTDYVFSGEKTGPYLETDPTGPLNQYGRTKLEGEQALLAAQPLSLIFRISWVYSFDQPCFYNTMRKLLVTKEELKVVADQIGAPSPAGWLADQAALVLKLWGNMAPEQREAAAGLYHLSPEGQTSWFGFAQEILGSLRLHQEVPCRLSPIPAQDYPTPAQRPANSVMHNRRLAMTFGLPRPDWLTLFFVEIAPNLRGARPSGTKPS
ncbi:MAG: dTDP-4-dehydrorhamnose reductase [Candidatus Lambdaproteobacteria bacterium RIFOXYD1_FULL_56_27]|uniref:dTDP-4-dehydrorhamnose reductase n=1 Tax=Candidatus Lambdaproteobacteria bacterium RIFOXYD2_FULL_56_26 TaxID=1817773 RepID=A0A1F6H1E0_9PROT|nr:MAG: dTDP-4-dehydrorhamnose reductase [Candidatus Lambdaproteobacteria bacterium RIFOXYC1_FULL_56_13]OGH04171.1 MAG: dTDP-4-dehydrorhamnose reductase [Candidatus Lambdaproteobacteria bacterium RIFOXYD2_FULL_56_26]OGH08307.1 MAG: dTDP-4-dehydrorhamnose reductase [Candidatus Lambdaproteobacteria bacterium RIFOXYD1_FULL_56_27]